MKTIFCVTVIECLFPTCILSGATRAGAFISDSLSNHMIHSIQSLTGPYATSLILAAGCEVGPL